MPDIFPVGHIYIFADPGVPNEFKIGHSSRDVDSRRSELSKETSRPRGLVELYRRKTLLDSKETEKNVHSALKNLGCWIQNSDKKTNEWFEGNFDEIIKIVDHIVNLDNARAALVADPKSSEEILWELRIASINKCAGVVWCEDNFLKLCFQATESRALIVDHNWGIQAAKFKSKEECRFGEYLALLAEHSLQVLDNLDGYLQYANESLNSRWYNEKAKQRYRNKLIDIYCSEKHQDFHKALDLMKKSEEEKHRIQWAYTVGNGVKFLLKADPALAINYLESSFRGTGRYGCVLKFIYAATQFDPRRDRCGIDFSKYKFDCSAILPTLEWWDLDTDDQKKADNLGQSPFASVLSNVFLGKKYGVIDDKPSTDRIEAYFIAGCCFLRPDFEFYFPNWEDLTIWRLGQDVKLALRLLEIAGVNGHKRALEALCYQYTNGLDELRSADRAQYYRKLIPSCVDDTYLKFPCFGLTIFGNTLSTDKPQNPSLEATT